MPGKLIQTTVESSVLRKFDALARASGHRRAGYLRHLVEVHVRALTPSLLNITRSTSHLDDLANMTVSEIATRASLATLTRRGFNPRRSRT